MKKHRLFLLFPVLFTLSCLTAGDTQTFVFQDVSIPADLMGMVHAGYANGNSRRIPEEYTLLDEMGVHWMLQDFLWDVIQPHKDTWNWSVHDKYTSDAADRNKKIMGLLLYDTPWIHGEFNSQTRRYACGHTQRQVNIGIAAGESEISAYCEYVRETVKRYKGKVSAWGIWNEPNMNNHFWSGTPNEFFALHKAAAAAIREADPSAVIIGGSLNPGADNNIWTRGLFESGAMDQVDFIAYHPYGNNPEESFQKYIQFRNYTAMYGFENRIWVTEIGYPLDKGPGGYDSKVREEFMPEATVKTITLLAAAGARHIFWYEMFDYGKNSRANDSEAWFGLVDFDTFIKKGGGQAYQLCARNFPGKTFRHNLIDLSNVPDTIAAYYFQGADGKHALVIWDNRPLWSRQIIVTLPGTNRQVWDIAACKPASAGESSAYTLQRGAGKSLLFFTWENRDTSQLPRISGF